jgi:major membrane immunogen (membrane-anchored lipoprotein)
MKKIGMIFVLALSILLTACSDEAPRDAIVSYVSANVKLLEAFPYDEMEKILFSEDKSEVKQTKEEEIINDCLGSSTIVKSVYAYNDDILSFYCGGSGMLKHSTYTGFYYSKNDKPFALEFEGCELKETTPGVFEWEDERHRIRTEKIQDYWYYYYLQWI